jgi:hypothetical protein
LQQVDINRFVNTSFDWGGGGAVRLRSPAPCLTHNLIIDDETATSVAGFCFCGIVPEPVGWIHAVVEERERGGPLCSEDRAIWPCNSPAAIDKSQIVSARSMLYNVHQPF